MKNILCLIICVFLTGTTSSLYANNPLSITSVDGEYSLGLHLEVLEDPEGKLSFEEVISSNNFVATIQEVPNLEISKSTFWVRFSIKNETTTKNFLLHLAYPIIDSVQFFSPTESTSFSVVKSGESVPFSKRKFQHQNFIFDIHLDQGEEQTYYLKVKSGEQIMLPLTIGTATATMQATSALDLYSGIYFGIVMVMLLYNLFIFFSVRDRSYLLYVLYILFVGLTQASDNGYTYKIFWPELPSLANFMVILFPSLVGSSAMLFMRHFLQTAKHTPKLDKGLFVFIGIYGVCISLFITGFPQISYQLTQINALTVSIFMLITAYKVKRKGFRPATFFLWGWSIFLTSVCLFVMKDLGVLPYNAFTKHILQIGSAIELVLLSFALADRINILKLEKEESQARTVEALKENERIMREQNVMLDTKVKERTAELEQSNQDLNIALTDLKEAQTQLVQAEKMASLGLLTAGIAHEINNPINFVVSNIKPLKRDIQDIIELLNTYAEIKDVEGLQDKLTEIEELKEEIDLEYILTEIEQLLQGMDDGANRTAEIVKGLKSFTRLDETELKQADINECIESTLLLLTNSVKNGTTIAKNFDKGEMLECYPGKLNQLFMNILKNALQAVEAKNYAAGETPTVEINTIDRNDEVEIQIKDNGVGMSESVKQRIFEPFFTTKDVGEGTGLGLSIAYNIVEKHDGLIEVESKEGAGTIFIVLIPKIRINSDVTNKEKNNIFKKERRATLKNRLKQYK